MWKKLEVETLNATVFEALEKNKHYVKENIIGVPASYLDSKVFSQDSSILKDAPFLTTMVMNPNHIGCHTLGGSESFFAGTQEIERKVIEICAEDILNAEAGACDGYVASGGTEANMQAMWIYRNYFIQKFGAKHEEIAILCSEHSHYSMPKAANILNVKCYKVETSNEMLVERDHVERVVRKAMEEGVKYFAVVANMMTTMYGSVDDPNVYSDVLEGLGVEYKMHVDAAFGGFYYPFSNPNNQLSFKNTKVTSVTMDAHKMAQAPYGTGIFLIRKGYMKYATTSEASYVEGEDSTLIGSRSGANAISIWMILSKYGPNEWMEKIFILQKRTDWLCNRLDEMNIGYYRNPCSNIVTIKDTFVSPDLAAKYTLVPDNHKNPSWYKVVVMEHVSIEKLELLVEDLKLN